MFTLLRLLWLKNFQLKFPSVINIRKNHRSGEKQIQNFSANKSEICKCGCKSPLGEGEKSCRQASTTQKAAICIFESNDRKVAIVVKSINECRLSERENNSTPFGQFYNFPIASINLQKIKKLLLRYPEITSGSSSDVEVVDERLEAATTKSREVRSKTVVSISSAFEGDISTDVSGECAGVGHSERL